MNEPELQNGAFITAPVPSCEALPDVVRFRDLDTRRLLTLLNAYGLAFQLVPEADAIPGSHWGDDEAGLIKNTLYARVDTPLHSIMHESCHWILMDPQRRSRLHTDAGGTQTEENAVCYLQILLADLLSPAYSSRLMCRDMDRWGYSFRLGCASAWFESDAQDAIAFLQERGHITPVCAAQAQFAVHLPDGFI